MVDVYMVAVVVVVVVVAVGGRHETWTWWAGESAEHTNMNDMLLGWLSAGLAGWMAGSLAGSLAGRQERASAAPRHERACAEEACVSGPGFALARQGRDTGMATKSTKSVGFHTYGSTTLLP